MNIIDKIESIESIESIKLPSIASGDNSKAEEEEYRENPQESQKDHKSNEALILVQKKAKLQLNTLTIENDNLKELSKHRITYSWWIFGFVIVFVLIVLGMVVASGLGGLKLHDNVLNTLLATNTVQAVGILYIIAKWLYPNK